MQFDNQVVNIVRVFDPTTNNPIVIIGPTPSITVQDPTDTTNYVRIFVDITGQPNIEFSAPNGDTYRMNADNADFSIGFTNLAGRSSFHIVDGEGIALRSSQTGAPSTLFDDDDGYLKFGVYSPWAPETWHAATLQNAWTTVGVTAFDEPGYMKDPTGRVWIRGVAANGNNAAGTTVFTLPAGYRPAQRKQFPITLNAGVALTAVCQVMEVGSGTPGEVKIYGVPAGNAIGFDEISFSLQ